MSAQHLQIFDGHNDTMLKLQLDYGGDEQTFWSGTSGHLDGPRARAGGMAGGICAIFIPNPRQRTIPSDQITLREDGFEVRMAAPIAHEYARELANKVIGLIHRLADRAPSRFMLVRTVAQLDEALATDRFAAVLHFEGAEAIDPDLELLPLYYEAGLRSLGPVWSRPNVFGHGVPFKYPCTPDVGPGLSAQGKALVKACDQLGVMLDLAHLNLKGFWDVAALSTKPLVVSHACVHAICPSARNLLDAQLDAIKASGGLVGVNFFVGDVRPDGALNADTPLTWLVRHLSYIADRIGVEHVALGSDFDGALMPRELCDASGLPRLIDALRTGGFNQDEIALIASQNWRRIFSQTWHA